MTLAYISPEDAETTKNLTDEQQLHLMGNSNNFVDKYIKKYANGQNEHGGNMWEMGLKQVLNNAEEEVLDMWSYIRQIRKCMDDIEELCNNAEDTEGSWAEERILPIINRVKEDK